MRRRDFISLIGGGAMAWPLVARAQQKAMPVIGLLGTQSAEINAGRLRAFRQTLAEAGYVEGENITVLYRWAENQLDRMPSLAAELAHQEVAVILAMAEAAALAVKATATKIPVIFLVSSNPVDLGLVASVARTGGNWTGIDFVSNELLAKRLGLLHEMLPTAVRIAVLVNPKSSATDTTLNDVDAAARAMGLQIQAVRAGTSLEIDAAFAGFATERPDALFVAGDPFFSARRVQLANLASRYAIPLASNNREITDAGGLMSYGANITDAWRQVGVYTARVLKGAKPADLPVLQASKFELIINNQTARMLGVTVTPSLLSTADEVIE
jgi:putative ABC transport system substrate-binding protein